MKMTVIEWCRFPRLQKRMKAVKYEQIEPKYFIKYTPEDLSRILKLIREYK